MPGSPRLSTVAVVVALLAVAGVGAAGLGSALPAEGTTPQEMVTVNGSTSYVVPDTANVTRQEYGEATLDVGATIAADAERLQARHDQLIYGSLDLTQADQAQRAVGILEDRVERVERRHDQLLRNYSAGDITTGTLLTELSRLEVAATQHRAAIDRLQEAELPDDAGDRLSAISVEPTLLKHPVTERVVAAKTGGEDPARVYVASAPGSLVAATVDDDTYVRQATLRDEHMPGEDQFAAGSTPRAQAAADRGSSLYSTPANTTRGFTGTNVYEFSANHSLGELTAYLDGTTTNPYHEHQFKRPVFNIPAETSSSTSESFRLNVQHTNATGPMAISLLGTDTGQFTPVTVFVDGDRAGTIEGSRQLWTIQPIGEFTVTAETADGETVSVTVEP